RPDPDRRLDQALVLDRYVRLVGPVVEVADVDPVADDRGRPDLDVEVAVDRAVVADHRLLADPQHALVRTQLDPFAEVRPAADDQLAVAAADLEPDAGPDEGVPLELDLGVPQPDPQVAQRGPQVS